MKAASKSDDKSSSSPEIEILKQEKKVLEEEINEMISGKKKDQATKT